MAKRKKKYKGIVKNKFNIKGIDYYPNTEYITDSKALYDYLINEKYLK